MIGFSEKRAGTPVVPMTREIFKDAINNGTVAAACEAIAKALGKVKSGGMTREDFTEYKNKLKARLPVLTPHALFKNEERKNSGPCKDNAVPTGMVMADFDHLEENPRQVYEQRIKPLVDCCGIVLVHVSAGGEGLHIIFRQPQGMTISEAQQWMGKQIGIEPDKVCHDLTRCSYLVSGANILFYSDGLFEGNPAPALPVREAATVSPTGDTEGVSAADEAPAGWEYRGIPLSRLVTEWLARNGGEPEMGNRNNTLYRLALDLRTVCDNSLEALMDAVSRFGLSEQEVKSTLASALRADYKLSREMEAIVRALSNPGQDSPGDDQAFDVNVFANMELPPALRASIEGFPAEFHWGNLAGPMPLLCALADGVTYRYCTGVVQPLGLMTIIIGGQASGKSVCLPVINLWKEKLDAEDAEAYAAIIKYNERENRRKAGEPFEPAPHPVIRGVAVMDSVAALFERLYYGKGHTLYSVETELGVAINSNKGGTWAQKFEIYKKSFYHESYSRDFLSKNSLSGKVNVAYNWTMTGTPGALGEFFSPRNVESGLASRIVPVLLPSNLYGEMPHFVGLSDENKAIIRQASEQLRQESGCLDLPRLKGTIEEWCEQRRNRAIEDGDDVAATFRMRSAEIAFRFAVIFYLLSEVRQETDAMMQFATTVADLTLDGQLRLFGEELAKQLEKNQLPASKWSNASVFSQLPEVFTVADVRALKQGCIGHSIHTIISRWVKAEKAEKIDAHHWKKTAK